MNFAATKSLAESFAVIVLAPIIGVVIAWFLLMNVVVPRTGLGQYGDRILDIRAYLEESEVVRPWAAILGNSITVEGIDASIVSENAPDWQVRHFGINGCDLAETSVLLPAVLESAPDAMVLTVWCQDLGTSSNIPLDKAFAYALAGYASTWPSPGWLDSIHGLTEESREALLATGFTAERHFRVAPMIALNTSVRERFNRGFRKAGSDDFTAPFNLLISIKGERLQRNLDDVRRRLENRLQHRTGAEDLQRIADMAIQSGVTPVMAIAPMHPRLWDECADCNTRLREVLASLAPGVRIVDASELLDDESYFADAIHPNEAGRAIYSAFLGAALESLRGDDTNGGA